MPRRRHLLSTGVLAVCLAGAAGAAPAGIGPIPPPKPGRVVSSPFPHPVGVAAEAAAEAEDGSVVVAGGFGASWADYEVFRESGLALGRFRPDGRADRSFGDEGAVRDDRFRGAVGDVALDAAGRIVVAGWDGRVPVVARYLPSGTPDTTFGNGGIARGRPEPPGDSMPTTLAARVLADGSIIVVSNVHQPVLTGDPAPGGLSLTRLGHDGRQLSRTTRSAPEWTADGERAYGTWVEASIQPDGSVVVVGSVADPAPFASPCPCSVLSLFLMRRFAADGSVDRAFGTAGRTMTRIGQDAYAADVARRHGRNRLRQRYLRAERQLRRAPVPTKRRPRPLVRRRRRLHALRRVESKRRPARGAVRKRRHRPRRRTGPHGRAARSRRARRPVLRDRRPRDPEGRRLGQGCVREPGRCCPRRHDGDRWEPPSGGIRRGWRLRERARCRDPDGASLPRGRRGGDLARRRRRARRLGRDRKRRRCAAGANREPRGVAVRVEGARHAPSRRGGERDRRRGVARPLPARSRRLRGGRRRTLVRREADAERRPRYPIRRRRDHDAARPGSQLRRRLRRDALRRPRGGPRAKRRRVPARAPAPERRAGPHLRRSRRGRASARRRGGPRGGPPWALVGQRLGRRRAGGRGPRHDGNAGRSPRRAGRRARGGPRSRARRCRRRRRNLGGRRRDRALDGREGARPRVRLGRRRAARRLRRLRDRRPARRADRGRRAPPGNRRRMPAPAPPRRWRRRRVRHGRSCVRTVPGHSGDGCGDARCALPGGNRRDGAGDGPRAHVVRAGAPGPAGRARSRGDPDIVPRRCSTHRGEGDTPGCSPDGRSIAYVGDDDGAPGLFVSDANGARRRQITSSPFEDGSVVVGYQAPVWSRDGRLLAFATLDAAGHPHVAVIGADGRGLRTVARGLGLSWGPGRQLAYTADGDARILDLESGTSRVLVRSSSWPQWSPRGDLILLGSTLVRPDGTVVGEPKLGWASWKPDGTALVGLDGTRIVAIDVARMRSRTVSTTGVDRRSPTWSRDGRWIAYIRYVGVYQLVIVDARTGRRVVAWKTPGSTFAGTVPVWGRDGVYVGVS